MKQAVWKEEKRWVSIAEMSTVFGIPYPKLEGIGLGLGPIDFTSRKDREAHRRGFKTVFEVMVFYSLCVAPGIDAAQRGKGGGLSGSADRRGLNQTWGARKKYDCRSARLA